MHITYQLPETATLAWVPCPRQPRHTPPDLFLVTGGVDEFCQILGNGPEKGDVIECRQETAERFHVGEYLNDELVSRGWTTIDCALRMGGDADVNTLSLDLLLAIWQAPDEHSAKKVRLGSSTAEGLARAFGGNAETWLNLDDAYHRGYQVTRRFRVVRTVRACKACDVTPGEGRLIGYTSYVPEWGVVWQNTIGDAWQHWGWLVEVRAESEAT